MRICALHAARRQRALVPLTHITPTQPHNQPHNQPLASLHRPHHTLLTLYLMRTCMQRGT